MKRSEHRRVYPCSLARFAAIFVLLMGISPKGALPQTGPELNELKTEIKKLLDRQEVFEKELLALKARVMSRGISADGVDSVISIAGSPSKGYENAQVVLVEFSDYRCPFCARHYRETMPRLQSDYNKTGKEGPVRLP